jgi:DNA-directed RNA polymerase subunit E"
MSEKACTNCHFITKDNVCGRCKSTNFSEDFSGLVVMFDPESVKKKVILFKEKSHLWIN